MFKRIKFAAIVISLLAVAGLSVPQFAYADAAADACDGVKLLDPTAKCDDATAGQKGFTTILQTIINVFSIVVGAVSVIMIIIGGFRYVISGGDSSATKAAKDTIMYAVIGLVIVIFAQVIVIFVLSSTTAAKPTPATPPKKTTQISSSIVA
ncbi:hypothetical protein KBD20_00905 [Candidatus Saccharibacteria bacterium]|nr:hypothetical protein [Candidatus Saccharibacteria bacterium]